MKFVFLIAFIGIIGALAAAGLFMLKNGSKADESATENKARSRSNMARALTVRIGLSVALFLFILLSYWMGWITPTGLPLHN